MHALILIWSVLQLANTYVFLLQTSKVWSWWSTHKDRNGEWSQFEISRREGKKIYTESCFLYPVPHGGWNQSALAHQETIAGVAIYCSSSSPSSSFINSLSSPSFCFVFFSAPSFLMYYNRLQVVKGKRFCNIFLLPRFAPLSQVSLAYFRSRILGVHMLCCRSLLRWGRGLLHTSATYPANLKFHIRTSYCRRRLGSED